MCKAYELNVDVKTTRGKKNGSAYSMGARAIQILGKQNSFNKICAATAVACSNFIGSLDSAFAH